MAPIEFLSRRGFAAGGTVSLALAAAARGQTGAPPDSGAVATQNEAANLLTVAVEINGKGPFRFVVDTGADRSVIADTTADALGLSRGRRVVVEGVVRSVPADTVNIDSLSYGPFEHSDMTVPVLPRADLRADGYLGIDTLTGTKVTLDFAHQLLIVGSPRPSLMYLPTPPSEVRVGVGGWRGHLYTYNATVDGIRTTAFIDTGAEVSVGNPALFDELVRKDRTYVRKDTVPLTGVTGGSVDGQITTLHRVDLGHLRYEECEVAIAALQIFGLWGFADTPALLIGMNWLRQFSSVAIDFARKEYRFNMSGGGHPRNLRAKS